MGTPSSWLASSAVRVMLGVGAQEPLEPSAPSRYTPNVYQSPPSECLCTCVGEKPAGAGRPQPLPVHAAGSAKKSGHSESPKRFSPSPARAQCTKSALEKMTPS